jgi:hypothetical protein
VVSSRPSRFNLGERAPPPRYLLDRRLGGPQRLSGSSGEEKNPSSCQELNPNHPLHSPVTTLTGTPRHSIRLHFVQPFFFFFGSVSFIPRATFLIQREIKRERYVKMMSVEYEVCSITFSAASAPHKCYNSSSATVTVLHWACLPPHEIIWLPILGRTKEYDLEAHGKVFPPNPFNRHVITISTHGVSFIRFSWRTPDSALMTKILPTLSVGLSFYLFYTVKFLECGFWGTQTENCVIHSSSLPSLLKRKGGSSGNETISCVHFRQSITLGSNTVNAKLPLCFIKHHVMKRYGVEVQLHTPAALSLGKEPPVTIR